MKISLNIRYIILIAELKSFLAAFSFLSALYYFIELLYKGEMSSSDFNLIYFFSIMYTLLARFNNKPSLLMLFHLRKSTENFLKDIISVKMLFLIISIIFYSIFSFVLNPNSLLETISYLSIGYLIFGGALIYLLLLALDFVQLDNVQRLSNSNVEFFNMKAFVSFSIFIYVFFFVVFMLFLVLPGLALSLLILFLCGYLLFVNKF